MATRPMIFCFIHVKTMANFRRGTWKLRENITLVVVKLAIKSTAKKVSQACECSLPESDARRGGSRAF